MIINNEHMKSIQERIGYVFKNPDLLKQAFTRKSYTEEHKNALHNEVLEFYVNVIYYGSGYYCIYDASKGYFKKEPKDMTDYECTLLVGIPNAPSVYSLNNRPDLAKQRQEKVIECMVDVDYITEDKANSIIEAGE